MFVIEYLKKNVAAILVFGMVAGIATCNYKMNTNHQKEIIENPKAGDYFVFNDYPKNNEESIMKVKEVNVNEVVFYIPTGGIIGGFELNKSESVVRDADKKGQMYGEETVAITKSELLKMSENDNVGDRTLNLPRIENTF